MDCKVALMQTFDSSQRFLDRLSALLAAHLNGKLHLKGGATGSVRRAAAARLL